MGRKVAHRWPKGVWHTGKSVPYRARADRALHCFRLVLCRTGTIVLSNVRIVCDSPVKAHRRSGPRRSMVARASSSRPTPASLPPERTKSRAAMIFIPIEPAAKRVASGASGVTVPVAAWPGSPRLRKMAATSVSQSRVRVVDRLGAQADSSCAGLRDRGRDGIVVPARARHTPANTGDTSLRLCTIYGPPNHVDHLTQPGKSDAPASHEVFGGAASEEQTSVRATPPAAAACRHGRRIARPTASG